MSNGNFPNGSLLMRIWRFDGQAEILAKFQYFEDAAAFGKAKSEKEPGQHNDFFYLAVCDDQCKAQGFGVKLEAPKS